MLTMYGYYDVTPKDDYFVGLAEKAIYRLSASAPPEASLFYTFPIIRYLPSWFPGTEFIALFKNNDTPEINKKFDSVITH